MTARPPLVRQLPSVAVLAVTACGLLLAALDRWQAGGLVVGLGLLLGAGLRLTLPPGRAGWLVVRSRSLDAGLLLFLGVAVVLLATTIPAP